jgi:hypothetical protein
MTHGSIAYRPQVSQRYLRAFDQHLSRCPGPWTLTRSFVHGSDPQVLCLRWIVPSARWCDVPGYLAFLDARPHRDLLRLFVNQAPKRSWEKNELSQLINPAFVPADLEAALSFCEFQEFLVKRGTMWQPGPRMEAVMNFGATLEWAVMEHLQRFHQAIARRRVVLKELQEQQLGDLDVLAFTQSDLIVTVECKSSTSGISNKHINRFLQRAALFPADIALLLIDTEDEQQLSSRLTQITQYLHSGIQHQCSTSCYREAGSQVYHLKGRNIYIGNTGGGISSTLKAVLQAAATLKHASS